MFVLLPLCLLLAPSGVRAEVTSSPLMGYEYERIVPKRIDVHPGIGGGRVVQMTFESSYYNNVNIVWKVDDKIIMSNDVEYSTFRHNQQASLNLPSSDVSKTIHCIMALNMYHVSIEIHLNGVTGTISVNPFTFDLNRPEGVTYDAEDASNLIFDLSINFPNIIHLNPTISSVFIAVDDCTEPALPIFGEDSGFTEHTEVNNENNFLENNMYLRDVRGYSQTVRVVAAQDPRIRHGLIIFNGKFMYPSSGSDAISLGEVSVSRMVFFKLGSGHFDLIPPNTVTLVDWTYRYEVDEHEDLEVSVRALGSPAPRVILARDGVDLTVFTERVDFTSPYYTHTIFRFRNVTAPSGGRYMVTVVSGVGRLTETFTVYVKRDNCP